MNITFGDDHLQIPGPRFVKLVVSLGHKSSQQYPTIIGAQQDVIKCGRHIQVKPYEKKQIVKILHFFFCDLREEHGKFAWNLRSNYYKLIYSNVFPNQGMVRKMLEA